MTARMRGTTGLAAALAATAGLTGLPLAEADPLSGFGAPLGGEAVGPDLRWLWFLIAAVVILVIAVIAYIRYRAAQKEGAKPEPPASEENAEDEPPASSEADTRASGGSPSDHDASTPSAEGGDDPAGAGSAETDGHPEGTVAAGPDASE